MLTRKRPSLGKKNEKSQKPSASRRGWTLGRLPIRLLAIRRVSSGNNSGKLVKLGDKIRPLTRTCGVRMGEKKMSLTFSATFTSCAINSLVGGRGGVAVRLAEDSVNEGVSMRSYHGHFGCRMDFDLDVYVLVGTVIARAVERSAVES